MKLTQRVEHIGVSATLEVARRAKELASLGIDVVDLSAGEPDFGSPPEAVEAAVDALRGGQTRYTAVAGIPELLAALSRDFQTRYSAPWEPGDFVVTSGGKAALFELALALYEDGDEVVLPTPYWVTFPEQIRLAGASPVLVETDLNEAFAVTADSILSATSSKTVAILLNTPCNPTGSVISSGDLRKIVEECAAREILVIVDETYERLIYDGVEFASSAALAAEYPDTVVLVGSFSKTYAMTGWRLGYLAGPANVVAAVRKLQGHLNSNATTFAMWGAVAALEQSSASIEVMLAEYQARRDLLFEGLRTIDGLECCLPAGAFYAFPRVSKLYGGEVTDSISFARELLEAERVAVIPGAAFGADEFIRISFACSREQLQSGLEKLGRFARDRSVGVASR